MTALPSVTALVPQGTPQGAMASDGELVARRLPSGRSIVLRIDGAGEEIEIRSARGELDVKIVLTDAGPVVSLRGARLEMEAPDVAVHCRNFDVRATGEMTLASQGEVRIHGDEVRTTSDHDIHMNGAFIRLNCTPDAPPPPTTEEVIALAHAKEAERLAAAAAAPSGPHRHDP